MRKIWKTMGSGLLSVALALSLTGCMPGGRIMLPMIPPSVYVPETVEADGNTYRTGFYPDELYPIDIAWTGEEYEINRVTFHCAALGSWDCLHAIIGETSNGEVYCLDSQWEEARDYYADPDNFTYYCEISPDQATGSERADIHPIEDMDRTIFESLFDEIKGTANNPFDWKERERGASREAEPIPSSTEHYYLTFYKKSNDGFFKSFSGDKFLIYEGKLYYVRYRDGDDDLFHVIQISNEIADYFINLVKSLDSPYSLE